MKKRSYNDGDARIWERVFQAVNGCPDLSRAISKLCKEIPSIPWSFHYLVELLENHRFQEWKADYLRMLREMAQLRATQELAFPQEEHKGQTRANANLVIAQGKLAQAEQVVALGGPALPRRPKPMAEPSDPGAMARLLAGPDGMTAITDEE